MKTRLLFCSLIVILLTSCANTSTIKYSQKNQTVSNIYLIPTGKAKIEGMSSTVGSAFGAVGVLIEAAVTSDSNREKEKLLNDSLSRDKINKIFSDAITERLGGSHDAKFHLLNQTELNSEFTEWFNKNEREFAQDQKFSNESLIIDFGFQHIALNRYFAGEYVEGTIGIRILDPKTGKVVARARTFGVGEFGGEKLSSDTKKLSEEEKIKVIEIALNQLIQNLVKKAMNKMLE